MIHRAASAATFTRMRLLFVCAFVGCGAVSVEVDAGSDAGSVVFVDAGTSDAGTTSACRGTGQCEALTATKCEFAQALGCAPVFTGSCGPRGNCSQQNTPGTCTAAGACLWSDAGCRADPLCPTVRVQQDCVTSKCQWTSRITSCTGSWSCESLDGGLCQAFAAATGLACF